MFVNLSNHPSTKWTPEQLAAAQAFGEVVDRPFPNIDPRWSSGEVDELVYKDVHELMGVLYKEAVSQAAAGHGPGYNVNAIHIMGETTYVVLFAKMWSTVGGYQYARLVCSTTERMVEELPTGEKKSTFQFVQFREM